MSKTIHSRGQQELCRILVEMRKTLDITQDELALRLGCQQSLVARLESGERRLDVIEFVAVARALESEPVEVLAKVERAVPPGHRI